MSPSGAPADSTNRIRWGIIGCGDVTEVKSGPGLQRASRSQLQAVMRRNGTLAQDYARRHSVPTWYSDAESLVADPLVDAIYVATPPYAHQVHVEMAAAAGKPVYVEKPMGRDQAEAASMAAACESGGVPLLVAYYRRALPRFLRIKELVETDAVGTPLTVLVSLRQLAPSPPGGSHWLWDPALSGGGLFVHMGSHMLDMLDFILGPIQEIEGRARNHTGKSPIEDCVTGAFEFHSGVHGMGEWSTHFSEIEPLDRTEIIGAKGAITFSTYSDEPIAIRRGGVTEYEDIPNPTHIQQPMIQTVVDHLLDSAETPSTASSARRTREIMDRLLGDYYGQVDASGAFAW